MYRSDYFNFNSGVNLFYSYSTCNSTADDWLDDENDKIHHERLDESKIHDDV